MADEKPLRLLVVAYEFPPSPSPQSLRWSYLTRELVALGHDVHVLAPDHPADGLGLPAIPPGLTVHRCFAGPLMGFLAARARRRRRIQSQPQAVAAYSNNRQARKAPDCAAIQRCQPSMPPAMRMPTTLTAVAAISSDTAHTSTRMARRLDSQRGHRPAALMDGFRRTAAAAVHRPDCVPGHPRRCHAHRRRGCCGAG